MATRLLDLDDLPQNGIKFSDTHLWRLIKAGRFPRPVKIGYRLHWSEEEIDSYIAELLARRENAA